MCSVREISVSKIGRGLLGDPGIGHGDSRATNPPLAPHTRAQRDPTPPGTVTRISVHRNTSCKGTQDSLSTQLEDILDRVSVCGSRLSLSLSLSLSLAPSLRGSPVLPLSHTSLLPRNPY